MQGSSASCSLSLQRLVHLARCLGDAASSLFCASRLHCIYMCESTLHSGRWRVSQGSGALCTAGLAGTPGPGAQAVCLTYCGGQKCGFAGPNSDTCLALFFQKSGVWQ